MGTDKRARQKANRKARLAEVEAEAVKETREESTRKFGKIAAVVGGIIAIIVLWNIFTGGDDDGNVATAEFVPTAVPEMTPTPVPEIVLATELPASFTPFAGERALTNVEPVARDGAYSSAPEVTIDQTLTYAAALNTDAGVIRFDLFDDAAPAAVNTFIALANDGFFDGLTLHSVEPGFVIQGGDPLGDGSGGAGYSLDIEVDPEIAFDARGLVAMGNAGGSNDSAGNFFITLSDSEDVAALTGEHTIFGAIQDSNAAALDAIEEGGDAVTIMSVRIIES